MVKRAKKREPAPRATAAVSDQAAKELGARLKTAVDAAGGYEAAAPLLGVHPNTLRRMVSGETDAKMATVTALAKLSGYRLDWLAFDEGPEKWPEDGGQRFPRGTERFYYVPEFDAHVAAGHGAFNEEPEIRSVFPVPLSMIEGMGVMPERLRMTEAKGDSMLPDIRHGDRLLFVVGEHTLRDGAIYIINHGEDTLVKEIQLEPDGGLTLISKNPTFAPRKITKADRDSLSFAGRVVGAIKRFV